MSPEPLIASLEVHVNGTALADEVRDRIDEIVVDQHVLLPDAFSMRLHNPGDLLDDATLWLGNDVEVLLAAPESTTRTSVFTGQITALEPDFYDDSGCTLNVRGYDHSHRLNRTRNTQTYQSQSYGDIARKVISASGLSAGKIDGGDGGVREFVQQSNETDWDFLWRLARDIDFELVVTGRKADFRRAGDTQGTPAALVMGETLMVFRPRLTGMQQVDSVTVRGWDPKSKQAIVATKATPRLSSSIGETRSKVASALGGGSVTIVDHPVANQAGADALAASALARLGNAFVEGEGLAIGDPAVRAGGQIKVSGVGTRFAGTYTLTQATHCFRPRDGYRTRFTISGRTPRSLFAAAAPHQGRPFGRTIAIGVVTNNQDPDGLGRVRVRCPELHDNNEGWWARIAAPAAGKDRGVLMMPIAGDEVLVAFSHAHDEFPYIVGALWNGPGTPGELVHPDGSFALNSDHQVVVKAKEAISVTGNQTIALSADQDVTVKAGGKLDEHATSDAKLASDANVEISAQIGMKLSAQTNLEAQAMAMMKLAASGQIQVQSDGAVQISGAVVKIQANGVVMISAPQILLG